MTKRFKKISEEQYKALVRMDRENAVSAMLAEAYVDWRCGYGIYGCNPVERNGEFCIEYITGDSCD